MHEDNAYIRGTASRPQPQAKELQDEADNAVTNIKVLQDVLERLNSRIKHYGSVDAISDEVLLTPDEFMHTVAANKIIRENLQQERDYLISSLPEGMLETKP